MKTRHSIFICMFLSLVLQCSVLAQSPTNAYTDQITFVSEDKAPDNFHNWTFFWTMPEVELGATLDYVVIRPDGLEDFQLQIPKQPAGNSTRSDFSKEWTGTDPSVFFGQHIKIRFRVTKGKMKFNAKATKFCFESFVRESRAITE
jgi:hypothetical protein